MQAGVGGNAWAGRVPPSSEGCLLPGVVPGAIWLEHTVQPLPAGQVPAGDSLCAAELDGSGVRRQRVPALPKWARFHHLGFPLVQDMPCGDLCRPRHRIDLYDVPVWQVRDNQWVCAAGRVSRLRAECGD